MPQPDADKPDVLLCNMPFGLLPTPSLALSLLRASLEREGMAARVAYFCFLFAEMLGVDTYEAFAQGRVSSGYHAVGEWIFSEALFGKGALDSKGYIESILRRPPVSLSRFLHPLPRDFVRKALNARGRAERFLEECLLEVGRKVPCVVGFSCIFQQRLASLCLAKRIKDRWPGVSIVFGGSDCEGVKGVELIRQFPFVDAVVSGKGDVVFPQLVKRMLEGKPLAGLRGVYSRSECPPSSDPPSYSNAVSLADLDDLPLPDCDDYFDQIKTRGLSQEIYPYLSLETSRGCWWGEHRQCTFCGLNGKEIAYRRKSGGRVLKELTAVSRKYPAHLIAMTDSVLAMDYFRECIPRMAKLGLDVQIKYEVRPTLTRDQIKELRNAGITQIQPGIESLSNPILRLMRKGTNVLQNLQCLKWCKEFSIYPFWNMLLGFPGEPSDAYSRMAAMIPPLVHLTPPTFVRNIELYRYSPLFERSAELGLANVAPSPAYNYIFPFDLEVIKNLASYFTYHYRRPQEVDTYTRPLREAIAFWRSVHETSQLWLIDGGVRLLIWDERPVALTKLTVLDGLERVVYLACDRARNLPQLLDAAAVHTGCTQRQDRVERILDTLLARHLMIRDGNRCLSLAVSCSTQDRKRDVCHKILGYLGGTGRIDGKQERLEGLLPRIKTRQLPKGLKISVAEMETYLKPLRKQEG